MFLGVGVWVWAEDRVHNAGLRVLLEFRGLGLIGGVAVWGRVQGVRLRSTLPYFASHDRPHSC